MQIAKGLANTALIVVIVIIVILAGVVGYFMLVKKPVVQQTNTPNPTPVQQTPESPAPTPQDESANWETYTNTDLGYSIKYPNSWQVDESGLQNSLGKEVIINPPSAEPFTTYISVSIDQRPLDLIRQVHTSSQAPIFIEKEISFANQSAFQFRASNSDSVGIYIGHEDKIFLVSTSKFSSEKVQQSFSSFLFTR
jgi:hypothetical protein